MSADPLNVLSIRGNQFVFSHFPCVCCLHHLVINDFSFNVYYCQQVELICQNQFTAFPFLSRGILYNMYLEYKHFHKELTLLFFRVPCFFYLHCF